MIFDEQIYQLSYQLLNDLSAFPARHLGTKFPGNLWPQAKYLKWLTLAMKHLEIWSKKNGDQKANKYTLKREKSKKLLVFKGQWGISGDYK